MRNKRSQYSQNFLVNRQLVSHLVRTASVGQNDTVLEIGPGRGIITHELAKVCHHVLAVEIDPALSKKLAAQLIGQPNITLFTTDFLLFPLPTTPYKVFVNLPFAIEGQVIRKLLDSPNPPDQTHLIVRHEVGKRWVGYRHESLFSLLHKPWFGMNLTHHFRRSDFTPKPKVESIMIAISKRKHPLIDTAQQKPYRQFLKQAFCGGKRLDTNLHPFFSKSQFTYLSRKLNFPYNARPTNLSFDQWRKLFITSAIS